MRKFLLLAGACGAAALLATGCAGPERKMGRGLNNTFEIVRGGEMTRSMEQAQFFPDEGGLTTGLVRGFDHVLARTGLGIYEVVTAPLPPYEPILTNYVSASPGYPDAYHPGHLSDSVFDTDHSLGFSGGDVAPWFPGSRFRIFDY